MTNPDYSHLDEVLAALTSKERTKFHRIVTRIKGRVCGSNSEDHRWGGLDFLERLLNE